MQYIQILVFTMLRMLDRAAQLEKSAIVKQVIHDYILLWDVDIYMKHWICENI